MAKQYKPCYDGKWLVVDYDIDAGTYDNVVGEFNSEEEATRIAEELNQERGE